MKVLLVDDSKTILQAYTAILHEMNVESDTATNGEEALEKVTHSLYDLIILDLNMPVLDGVGFLERIQGRSFSTPILVCSVYNQLPIIKKAIQLGAIDYIIKPIDFTILKSKLEAFL